MLIKSHEQLNQAVCEIFFSSQLSKMGLYNILHFIVNFFTFIFTKNLQTSPVHKKDVFL